MIQRAELQVPGRGTRWVRRFEEDHQLTKQSTGLDAGQVIRWKSGPAGP